MFDIVTVAQTLIRRLLVNDVNVLALVDANNIRTGHVDSDKLPSIIMGNPQVINHGNAAGGQRSATVYLDLHVWALDHEPVTASQIAAAVTATLWDRPTPTIGYITDYERPDFRFMRDPDPDRAYRHGVGTVEITFQWRP